MQSRLSFICDRVIEAGWLAAAIFAPLYFNVYSSRVFEPDKISMERNIVLMMSVAWFIKLIEGALSRQSVSRRNAEAEESFSDKLTRLLRVPMMIPIILYAAMYLFGTITSIVPLTSFFGSYQRLQGLISQYTYIMLALMVLANMRSRAQLERLITFAIVGSMPVAAYGLLQATGHDPLPWAGDVQTRVASSMGNAIFVAAYLIMIVPLTLQRLIGAIAERRRLAAGEVPPPAPADPHADPWPLAIIGSAAVFMVLLFQYLGMTTGNKIDFSGLPIQLPQDYSVIGDVLIWILVLAAGAVFVWIANTVASQQGRGPTRPALEDGGVPPAVNVLLPIIQVLVLGVALLIVGSMRVPDFSLWIVLPAGIFIFYALTYLYTLSAGTTPASNTLQVVGLPILILMQVVVIFLTQSRGPELGLLVGLVVFAFAYVLRRRMFRAAAVAAALVLLGGAFLLVFNLPDSPIASWRNLPYIGRLGLISQVDEGTGKVRELIWGGALKMITADPVRMIIGYGPESMYVGYNKFYPPDLGHWELRNATPDRSHDVFFDQGVTLGLLGLGLYLFLVGSFFWYATRALRKAPELHDQLILIGFLAMGVAHLGELVTGIQIVATYTYFYLGIAGTVVLGYVLNDYLRKPEEAPVAAEEATDGAQASVPIPEPVLASTANGHNGHEDRPIGGPARRPAGAVAASGRTNGRAATVPAGTRRGAAVGAPVSATPGARRPAGGGPPQPPGRIPPGGRTPGGPRVNIRGGQMIGAFAASRPPILAAYVMIGLIALFTLLALNVNLVKADMFYKQGLAYDQAQQWPGAIGPYEKALAISPNEDFYYLFLGRAYMEWAKVVAQNPQAIPNSPPSDTLLARAEQSLNTAKGLNPLNTDHYANLGRLYVYWGDAKGGDPSYYAKGIADYEHAHQLSPGNAGIWNELALAYAKAGRFQDAMTAIRGSQAMDDRYDQTPFIAAEIERSQSEQYGAEIANPPAGVVTATLTVSATQMAQAAAKDYASAVLLTPSILQDNQFDARVQTLKKYDALQPLAAAYQQVISQALELKAKDPTAADEPVQARSSLGYIEWQMGNNAEAIQQFQRAVTLQCNDFYNLQDLGMLYLQAGNKQQALNMLQGALAVADCNPADAYTGTCAALQQSTKAGSCTPLTGDPNMSQTVNSLRSQVGQLKQQLGQP